MNNLQKPIYLDYASTTPVDKRVIEKMLPFLNETFGNPASSSHIFGWKAENAVNNAREEIAKLIKCDNKEIIFTSGATESDNLAIKGAAHFYKSKGKHLITVKTEHKAVLDTMRELERQGYEVTYLDVQENGLIDINKFVDAIKKDTILASIMWVNNEIGVIQDIDTIGKICKEKGIIFHVDAAQAAGKIDINIKNSNIDLMSLSAHKLYGPKGIGAIFVRRQPRVRLESQIHGGGHERGFRSGTLPTHQIVGMGEAYRIAKLEMNQDNKNAIQLRDVFLQHIKDIEEVYINGDLQQRIPQNLNLSFNYVEGESMMMAVKELALSSGSACTSASLEPSYVLRALGRNDELAHSSLRITTGKYTTKEEMIYAAELIKQKISTLRDLSPLWEMYKEGIDLNSVKWTAH